MTGASARLLEGGRRLEAGLDGDPVPRVVQHAPVDRRAYLHPLIAPDGAGVLTEDAPGHHPWQHGLYVGLNGLNGIGFWTEGLAPDTADRDGTFHPAPMRPPNVNGASVTWTVESEWRGPKGEPMLDERQAWAWRHLGETYTLDLEWSLTSRVDLTFARYPYGGLFLRTPYRGVGTARNSEGRIDGECESARARWVAVTMPIPDRSGEAGIAMMDHPANPEHPVPWRVDGQFGIAPSRCIAGEWRLERGESTMARHRLLVFSGPMETDRIEASWASFAREEEG